MKIHELPDYPAITKLAAALWKQDLNFHGAAVMVGSGFSRSAAISGDESQRLPLWFDLSSALSKQLGSSGTLDPLRLAEEFCAYFGKQALHDLVKKSVNDAAWSPGRMHEDLLVLPWSEVLTTNWDTLLERSANKLTERVYATVLKQEDLASAPAPRIAKLHGTINITEELIFTQEDYRQYPHQYAAFVNFARQVFIENELCLIGFSGDDPNFLQWAGWVRDNLTTHARRIYLAGALQLSAAKRKYLESLNIAPIDLAGLVSDYDGDTKHAKATEFFLEELKRLQPQSPWKWRPTKLTRQKIEPGELDKAWKDDSYAASLLEKQIPVLQSDRESYPGWLICPVDIRWEVSSQLNDPFPTPKNIAKLSDVSRQLLLYEIAWRHGITLAVVPEWLVKELILICDPGSASALSKRQQLEIALLLLKNTRWDDYGDIESGVIKTKAIQILEKHSSHWGDCANELAFYLANVARDKFDYQAMESALSTISISSPVWGLRKASLLAEIGAFEEGRKLVLDAYQELQVQHKNSPNSIYIYSRLAWAHWIFRGIQLSDFSTSFEAFPSIYREKKCAPDSHIDALVEQCTKVLDKQSENKIEPLFSPGSYRDGSKTISFSNENHPFVIYDEMADRVGLPLRWEHLSYLVEVGTKIVRFNNLDDMRCLSLSARISNSDDAPPLRTAFSRIRVANLTSEVAETLQNRFRDAINYWVEKRTSGTKKAQELAVTKIRVFLECYARLVTRASVDQAKSAFRLSAQLMKTDACRHFWLLDALRHLSQYALESIPKNQHADLLVEALQFPLATETGYDHPKEWPNPIIETLGERPKSPILDRRIDEIIDTLVPSSSRNSPALQRLLPLNTENFLLPSEKAKLASKIWDEVKEGQLPETGLLKHALLILPCIDEAVTHASIKKYLFESTNKPEEVYADHLKAMVGAANNNFFPEPSRAQELFLSLSSWRRKLPTSDFTAAWEAGEEDQKAHYAGFCLSRAIVPVLPPEALSEDNFDLLNAFYADVRAPSVLTAFVYFSEGNKQLEIRVAKVLQKALQDKRHEFVSYAARALLKWCELAKSAVMPQLVSRLVYQIESGRVVGLPSLLWTANRLFNNDWLTADEVSTLSESLPAIFDGMDYTKIDGETQEAISASTVRAECVRFARDILSKGTNKDSELLRILEQAQLDPLPEVRFSEAWVE
jgi:hypothetical protein